MKNLKKWTKKDMVEALDRVVSREDEDWKDHAGRCYDAMEDYAYQYGISMKGVPG